MLYRLKIPKAKFQFAIICLFIYKNDLTTSCSPTSKKQDEPQSTASFVFTPTSPSFQLFPLCLLNPPQLPFFFFFLLLLGFRVLQHGWLLKPQSQSRVRVLVVCKRTLRFCAHLCAEESVTLSCDIVK